MADVKPQVNYAGFLQPIKAGDTLGVVNGGSGATTLTAHGVMLGAGTSAVHFATPSTAGYVLTDNGAGVDPSFQAAPSGGVSSFNTRTGAVTLTSGDVTGALTFTPLDAAASSFGGSALKWTTGRTLSITGDLAYISPSFDGSGNVTAAGTLATVNSNVGSFTNANITVNAKGLITAAASGSGGSGTVTTTGSPASGNLAKFSGATSIVNGDLSGDVTTSGTLATTLATSGVTANTYGSGSTVPIITVDAKGRITSVSTATISGGGSGTSALDLITEVVTAGSQASVTFSSIPATYRHLIVRVSGRSGLAAATNQVLVQYNGDTAANYDGEQLQAFNTTSSVTALQSIAATQGAMGYIPAASATANVGGGAELLIYDYRGTTFQKSADYHSGVKFGTAGGQQVTVSGFHAWRLTAAINAIRVFLESSGTFVNGTVVSLYGSL